MKFFNQRKSLIFIAVLFVQGIGNSQSSNSQVPPDGGGEYVSQNSKKTDCISLEERKSIYTIKEKNIEKLKLFQLNKSKIGSQVNLDWPLQASNQLWFNSYYGISNFVDLNPNIGSESFNQYGNTNLDYNCGNRSYDTNNGYNHGGIDIYTWPYQWYLYENDLVEVIAAQSGYITFKEDGNFDQNCSCNGSSNTIIIQHSDGSEAWYVHMKKFSLTNKSVGDFVNQGEYLGIVGSSGCSTNPHLHFEIRDSNDDVIEPFSGSCNNTTSSTWWNNQVPYRDPTINALITHFDAPIMGCPSINENPKISTQFHSGDFLLTAAYYRDQLANEITNYRIRRPDGTIWKDWSHSSNETYSSSWWYWTHTIPFDAECGDWVFEADFYGSSYAFPFQVGESISAQISASGSTEFCEGESVELTASGGISFKWTSPSGVTTNTPTVIADEDGIYQVEITTADNCSYTVTQSIIVYSNPTAQIMANGSTEFCEGESVELTASSGSSYQWTGPNGFTSTNQTITASQNGIYQVEVTNEGNCSDSETQTIVVHQNPIITNITGDINPEANSIKIYSIDNPNMNSQYNWSVTNGMIISGQGTSVIEIEWTSEIDTEICAQENDQDNCISAEYCIDIELILTSITDISENKIELFPNPCSNSLKIRGMNLKDIDELSIISSIGQILNPNYVQNDKNIELDLSELNNGVYFLNINIEHQQIVCKFIKIE